MSKDSNATQKIDSASKNYNTSVKNWAGKELMYSILLNKLFDNRDFEKRIYNPMINLGVYCSFGYIKRKDPYISRTGDLIDTVSVANFNSKINDLATTTHDYLSDLYDQIE